jgi:hypothetical protein
MRGAPNILPEIGPDEKTGGKAFKIPNVSEEFELN